jgi:hypothetical protein
MTMLADHGGGADIRDAVLKMGKANGWIPARALITPTIWPSRNPISGPRAWRGPGAAAPTKKAFDFILSHPPASRWPLPGGKEPMPERWCWCDALFMAPPA